MRCDEDIYVQCKNSVGGGINDKNSDRNTELQYSIGGFCERIDRSFVHPKPDWWSIMYFLKELNGKLRTS